MRAVVVVVVAPFPRPHAVPPAFVAVVVALSAEHVAVVSVACLCHS